MLAYTGIEKVHSMLTKRKSSVIIENKFNLVLYFINYTPFHQHNKSVIPVTHICTCDSLGGVERGLV